MGCFTGMGWMPAVAFAVDGASTFLDSDGMPLASFAADDEAALVTCYVTPHIDGVDETEYQWNRLRDAIVAKYGD